MRDITFKVGDWITYNGINYEATDFDARHTVPNGSVLWKPTEGEWCVFYNIEKDLYSLEKYKASYHPSHFKPLEFAQTLKG